MYSTSGNAISKGEVLQFLKDSEETYFRKGSNGYTTKHTLRTTTTLRNAYTGAPIKHLLVKHIPYFVDRKPPMKQINMDVHGHEITLNFQSIHDVASEYQRHVNIFWDALARYNQQMAPMPLHIIFDRTSKYTRTGMATIVMEYIEKQRDIEDRDIPFLRGLLVQLTKLGYLHGDFSENNFIWHEQGFVVFIDFGYTVTINDKVMELLQQYFGDWGRALQSDKAFQYVYLANMLLPNIISRNGCFDRKTSYSLYQYMTTGALSTFDPDFKCVGNSIARIDFDHFFNSSYQVDYFQNRAPDTIVKPPLRRFKITNEINPSLPLTIYIPYKYTISHSGRLSGPSSSRRGGTRRKI